MLDILRVLIGNSFPQYVGRYCRIVEYSRAFNRRGGSFNVLILQRRQTFVYIMVKGRRPEAPHQIVACADGSVVVRFNWPYTGLQPLPSFSSLYLPEYYRKLDARVVHLPAFPSFSHRHPPPSAGSVHVRCRNSK